MTEDKVDVAYEEPLEFVGTLDALMIRANKNKNDDGASSEDRRRWAIVNTELEKVKAYVLAYLSITEAV